MGGFKIDRGGAVMVERIFPARDAHAPFIARFEPRETPLRMRRDQVVSIEHGKIQKLLCDLNANGVLTDILGTCSTKAVAIESGHWILTTTSQFFSQNIRWHKASSVNSSPACHVERSETSQFISSRLIQKGSEILRFVQNDMAREVVVFMRLP
jgi:hypothetical protein